MIETLFWEFHKVCKSMKMVDALKIIFQDSRYNELTLEEKTLLLTMVSCVST